MCSPNTYSNETEALGCQPCETGLVSVMGSTTCSECFTGNNGASCSSYGHVNEQQGAIRFKVWYRISQEEADKQSVREAIRVEFDTDSTPAVLRLGGYRYQDGAAQITFYYWYSQDESINYVTPALLERSFNNLNNGLFRKPYGSRVDSALGIEFADAYRCADGSLADSCSSGLTTAEIVGIVLGVVFGVALIATAIICYRRKKRQADHPTSPAS